MIVTDTVLILTLLFLLLIGASMLVHVFLGVPYVPSESAVVAKMIAAAKLKSGDTVFDLGCGDGRLLFAAEKKVKVKTIGYEVAPAMFLLAHLLKILAKSKAKIHFKSLFSANLAGANVIFCYLMPGALVKLSEKIKRECKKGTRIVSNTFGIPGLELVEKLERDKSKGLPSIYLYKV
ncbi:50S ribosomal protein L11 methyltransferase [Candidatus Peregrinibacteria bacterium]|nr:50S ribosomal protein L11 methyltransferase [Candidatus Peregrinibacteria bacterium]